jgi:hypothetical protein
MKLSAFAPVFLFSLGTLTACGGGGSDSVTPDTAPDIIPDTTAPVITLNGESSLTHSVGSPYTDLGATANDAIDGSVDVAMTGAVDSDVIKSYTLTYTATDAAGNQSSKTRTVNVIDDVAPVITLNGEATITLADSVAYTEKNATAVDNVDSNVVVTRSGEVLTAPGTYTITYTAIDTASNEATATRTVIVEEDIVPEVFTFTEQAEVFLNTEIESDVVTITGVNVATPVSITNGEFSINGGDYTSAAATITSGQNIKVRTTSGAAVGELKQVSLTVGSLTSEFDVTSRTAEPSGLFAGTGTFAGVTDLATVKGIISNEHFMLFDEAQNVLYDGNILTYTGNDFTATVDVYKDGVNSQTVAATGSITNQTSFALTLTGDSADYGQGSINVVYDNGYETAATQARFKTESAHAWGGQSNSISQGYVFAFKAETDANVFTGGIKTAAKRCEYGNNGIGIPNNSVNIFVMNFDSEDTGNFNCDHVGINYKGYSAIFDVGIDGVMWFAATNGINSTFSVLTYQSTI